MEQSLEAEKSEEKQAPQKSLFRSCLGDVRKLGERQVANTTAMGNKCHSCAEYRVA